MNKEMRRMINIEGKRERERERERERDRENSRSPMAEGMQPTAHRVT